MNVYKYGYEIKDDDRFFFKNGCILLLGEFELFHKGHEQLLKFAKQDNYNNLPIGILILNVPSKKYIQTLEDRLYNLARHEFDFVIVANLDFQLKNTKGDKFIYELINKYNVKNFITGKDFRFGLNREYRAEDIKEKILKEQNIDVNIVDIKEFNNKKISSSLLKEMYEYGELNSLKNFFSKQLTIKAEIFENQIIWNSELIKPHFGIYYCQISIDDFWYSGLIHFSIENKVNFKLINNVQNINIFNQKTLVKFFDLERIITNKRLDEINDHDIEKAKMFFSK